MARKMSHDYIGTEHMFLTAFRISHESGGDQGLKILEQHGLTLTKMIAAVNAIIGISDKIIEKAPD